MRSGGPSAKNIRPFVVWWRVTVGLFRRSGGVRSSRGLASGSSIREIAKRLDRVASTVSREVARHGGRADYRANEADSAAALCQKLRMGAGKIFKSQS